MPKASKSHIGHHGFLNPATVILICTAMLTVLGATILFSASLPVDNDAPFRYIEKQAVWIGITLLVGLAIVKVDLEWLRRFIWVGYALGAVLLIAVLIPGIGHYVNGSRSWIRFGPIGFQVAEFAKIGLIFFIAHYFSAIRNRQELFFEGFIYPCIGIGLYVGLVILQPDLGTALIMVVVSVCLLFLAGVRLRYLIPSVTAGFGAIMTLIYFLDPERWSRLTAYLDTEAQKSGDAYQVWQAILAFAAGGLEGVGIGNGRQQLNFLPEAHTDFILAIVGEELGLIATLAVLVIYAVLFSAGILHLKKSPNNYQYLLAWGCLLLITVQSLVNLGVVTGALPTTGLPLPFISYGGSNFLTMGICVALLVNTSLAWRKPALKQSKRKLKEID